MSKSIDLSGGYDLSKALGYTIEYLKSPDAEPLLGFRAEVLRMTVRTATDESSRAFRDALSDSYIAAKYKIDDIRDSPPTALDDPTYAFNIGTTEFRCNPDTTQRPRLTVAKQEIADLKELQELLAKPDVSKIAHLSCLLLGDRGVRAEVQLMFGNSPDGRIFKTLAPHKKLPPDAITYEQSCRRQTTIPRRLEVGTLSVTSAVEVTSSWLTERADAPPLH
ncbi:MAG TPA: hypothetical protein VLF60_04245 [Candidatus Saccharimonadales bacterium]|nr:hypothetical protein [Candidatus Saccharimonadales bacterium]